MNNYRNIFFKRFYLMLTMLFCVANVQLSIVNCQLGIAFAQAPKIGGNVYGGGNQADVDGSTKVTIVAGDIGVRPDETAETINKGLTNPRGKVFGGARMANVGGNTFVHIDGEHATDYIVANYVYGGNDIAGTVGTAAAVGEDLPTKTVTTESGTEEVQVLTAAEENGIDNTWNSYVRISSKTKSNSNYSDEEAATYNSGLTGAIAKGALTSDQITAVNTALSLTGDAAYSESNKDISAADAATYNATLPGAVSTGDMKSSAKIYIGQLFAGGNGDYFYDGITSDRKTTHNIYAKEGDKEAGIPPIATRVTAEGETGFTQPELLKTYLEVKGGSIVYAYGGGNNATVKEETVIHVDNPTQVVNDIRDSRAVTTANSTGELLTTGRFLDMGINMGFSYPSSDAFQVGRFFGGNNQVAMAIRPKWNLLSGKIRNLYSGGNQGDMTHPNGIFLNIPETSTLVVDNVYGGCRMADVHPLDENGDDVSGVMSDIPGFNFPPNLAARVIIQGGDVNNVYGGNDVRGRVYFGNAIGINTSIRGNVYGGGNGAYPYTDNSLLKDDPTYGDLYYNPVDVLAVAGITGVSEALQPVTALNEVRPNAEQVSILLRGTEEKPTIIHGSVYVGGNCATLKKDDSHSSLEDYPLARLVIGSYVTANNVFLGNNGEGMVTTNEEERPDGVLKKVEGVLRTYRGSVSGSGANYNSMDLKTDPDQMSTYMDGVALDFIPSVEAESEANGRFAYEPYTSWIGSLFYGGNRGSMTYEGPINLNPDARFYIYEKLVAGCNNGNVKQTEYNAAYEGGILGSLAERDSYTETVGGKTKIRNRVEMNLSKIRMQPMRWDDEFKEVQSTDADITDGKLKAGEEYYATPLRSTAFIADGTETVASPATYFRLTQKGTTLGWNTARWESSENDFVPISTGDPDDLRSYDYDRSGTTDDIDRRLLGGNIYGGCYESGHVNGNVVINLNESVMSRYGETYDGKQIPALFAWPTLETNPETGESEPVVDKDGYESIDGSKDRGSGVLLGHQRDDLMSIALSVFGGGKGADTEIWGSTTVNLNRGYTFQIFGGSEEGIVGKPIGPAAEDDSEGYDSSTRIYTTNGKRYEYDSRCSATVNLNGDRVKYTSDIYSSEQADDALAEAEYLYGGGNEGDVTGNTLVNLGNGRIYDAFGGASDANILGHSEVYIGRQPDDVNPPYKLGFPWVRDIVYGGNDFGGIIHGVYEGDYVFTNRVKDYSTDKEAMLHSPGLLQSSSYVEFVQGRVESIYGGGYGDYEYSEEKYKDEAGNTSKMPYLHNTFVNIRPTELKENSLASVFGGGEGHSGAREGDNSQDCSYILIDIPDNAKGDFANLEVFGSGSYNGLGMRYHGSDGYYDGEYYDPINTFLPYFKEDSLSAVIDLLHGQISAVYGGSYNEGNTARSVINVPKNSTIKVGSIYGGAYGTKTLPPCDVFESNINYKSGDAETGTIYGGNNNERRTLFTHVNIHSPVWSNKSKGWTATVFGAGRGENTWSEYTDVNLEDGAYVYEVYGGGKEGHVLNSQSVQKYMTSFFEAQDCPTITDPRWVDAWTMGGYYAPDVTRDENGDITAVDFTKYVDNYATSLSNSAIVTTESAWDDRDFTGYSDTEKAKLYKRYNTNVRIKKGAIVEGYAYGGGLGVSSKPQSGDVWGTTYIALLGGIVKKNLYAAGSSGGVCDAFGLGAYNASTNPNGFTASANAYVRDGSVRNVFGGGWEGHVGMADSGGDITKDIPGVTHVVVGKVDGTTYFDGIPAVERNVYGGGEGGSVFGTANTTVYNGYIGYRYLGSDAVLYHNEPDQVDGPKREVLLAEGTPLDKCFVEKIDDETNYLNGAWQGKNSLIECGNVYGSGYDDLSSVDHCNVNIYGGDIRSCAFGGGEISIVGRGTKASAGADPVITKAGSTQVNMYGGHVMHNVYGGGKGYNSLGYGGGHNKYTDGYVFGKTEVNIHGGEIGTGSNVAEGYGNVFGGGDAGHIHSAYEEGGETKFGTKKGKRYDDDKEGYYYKPDGSMTEDCKVLIEPMCKLKTGEFSVIEILRDITKTESETTTTLQHTGDIITSDDLTALTSELGSSLTADEDYTNVKYKEGDYVPIDALNTLQDRNTDATKWESLDDTGIIIHNAVFAGGNIEIGSSTQNVDATTVFGNATASLHDVFHRDLITLGTGRVGGLYGDGNLTFVDGYRGLNITNYGTDYYNITSEIGFSTYEGLPDREKAYYELRYKCITACTDAVGKSYWPEDGSKKASYVSGDDLASFLIMDDLGNYSSVRVDANGDRVASGGTAVLTLNNVTGIWEPNPAYWEQHGVCSRYRGRIMNTIQRADFCGVFGSRMVMMGARDRVPDVADFTNYTINRVREVSLNKKVSKISSDLAIAESDVNYYKNHTHGNYFGIFSKVNFLGGLTSDVFFTDKRTTDNTSDDLKADGKTFYEWKKANIKNRLRNRAKSYNEVALASGVYLELTTEKSTGTKVNEKDWGYVTGIIGLDLINVQQGIGGGFVYAKNEHGDTTYLKKPHVTLTALNKDAVTRKDFTYKVADSDQMEWETSGNFVNDDRTIIDDCYPESNRYTGDKKVPAHYWYIKGQVYVYDQYISAYTGAPNAYSETVNIPLTITAASHGTMTLQNVQPNLYAYYSKCEWDGKENKYKYVKLTDDPKDELEINNKTYKLNDPITYWDYYLLSDAEKKLFVPETYVVKDSCYINSKYYAPGDVLLNSEYITLYNIAKDNEQVVEVGEEAVPAVQKATVDKDGTPVGVTTKDADNNDVPVYADFYFVFRESNNVRHDTGYMLTYDVNNPKKWNVWYTPKIDDTIGKIDTDTYNDSEHPVDKNDYHNGPTYKPYKNGIYGQERYAVSDIIGKGLYDDYVAMKNGEHGSLVPSSGQAVFEPAWFVTKTIDVTTDPTNPKHLYAGSTIVESDFSVDEWTALSNSKTLAYVCTSTIELSETEYIYANDLMSEAERTALLAKYDVGGTAPNTQIAADIKKLIQPAYYCTTAGLYGGSYYSTTENYRGLATWSSFEDYDRYYTVGENETYEKFHFNYDALDLLIDDTFGGNEGQKYQYDGKDLETGEDFHTATQADTNPAKYSLEQPIDYSATYDGTESLPYIADNNASQTAKKGDELSRTEYERLPNEQRHYSAITVPSEGASDEAKVVYVVHSTFIHGDTPYAAGQTISEKEFKALSTADQTSHITTLTFPAADAGNKYYYCREGYTINSSLYPDPEEDVFTGAVKSINGVGTGVTYNTTVPAGIVISAADYGNLVNRQQNFTIHGTTPVETSTLYVSRQSDIYDLSKEKVITVIYKYDYEEADGNNVTPVSERHVVNIHLQFESGIPIVENITPPQIILPGDKVNLRKPNVKPGAYEVIGGGWMLFEKEEDSENHSNGIPFEPSTKPLYWYQNNWYAAYYAKTYLGRTYSNAVPVRVANYHDMDVVMSDQRHHMYVDYPYVERDSKIYIKTTEGLDKFKSFFDLSLLHEGTPSDSDPYAVTVAHSTAQYPVENDGLITSGAYEGHAPLNAHVKSGQNLQFYLSADIDHGPVTKPNPAHESNPSAPETITENRPWTPIANNTGECFEGNLHGDGHTISGLDHSLFNHLCGNVYNIGVTGTFTGAGVAETGTGYVENAWVSATSTAEKTSQPVFGNPSRNGSDTRGQVQVVNSYYLENDADAYTDATTPKAGSYTKQIADNNASAHGTPVRKPAKAFYNGEVTYDLNGFYLYKRYCDKQAASTNDKQAYEYFTLGDDNKLALQPVKHYDSNPDLCSSGYLPANALESYDVQMYVEDRFWDGDFRYAAGTIPEEEDERIRTEGENIQHGYPIWPDDYLFFGQTLNYGHVDGYSHQETPTAINRSEGRVATDASGNRVYRAPAYFQSKEMNVAYFNPYAVFAQGEKLTAEQIAANAKAREAYKNMTAIDFSGGNGDLAGGYKLGLNDTKFYPPLLDDDGLTGFRNVDLTKNLLAYTFATDTEETAGQKTANVVSSYLYDPVYSESDEYYRNVAHQDDGGIYGHWVEQQSGGTYRAKSDHFLVDKQDFNAPIQYTFDIGKRMWYQREPADNEFVDLTKGWQDISLPFSAEVVTTNSKGEITHFYDGNSVGHEYWLREYKGNIQQKMDENNVLVSGVYTADFNPISGDTEVKGTSTETMNKTYTNSFLWDYYYEGLGHSQNDYNYDKYQVYYKPKSESTHEVNKYNGYPMLTRGMPYLIGFPGQTYYEFDLSGIWEALTTASTRPALVNKQTITFASSASSSDKPVTIHVSDDEMLPVTLEGYTYVPNYLSKPIETGNTYVLNTDGSSYDVTTEATTGVPFRPYFQAVSAESGGGAKEYKGLARSIVFSRDNSQMYHQEESDDIGKTGNLLIRGNEGRIFVTSTLQEAKEVVIVTASGALVDRYTIQPGETRETRVTASGVYLVNKKKISMKVK